MNSNGVWEFFLAVTGVVATVMVLALGLFFVVALFIAARKSMK